MDGYSFQAQVTRIAPIGLVPGGLRSDVGFTGTLTDGPLVGSTIEGVDYLLIRHDGVAVIDARELITALWVRQDLGHGVCSVGSRRLRLPGGGREPRHEIT